MMKRRKKWIGKFFFVLSCLKYGSKNRVTGIYEYLTIIRIIDIVPILYLKSDFFRGWNAAGTIHFLEAIT